MGKKVKGLSFYRRKERKMNIPVMREVFIWVFEIAAVVGIAFVFTYFFGVRKGVAGASMAPQLEDGDEALINRFSYRFFPPKAGDVIAFFPNGNTNAHYYIKRIVGVPGDTVQIIDGVLYINDEPYEEKTDVARMEDAGLAAQPVTLADDEYFVLGDNRNNSEDSRYANIGNVRESYMIGRVWFLLMPTDKIGLIK